MVEPMLKLLSSWPFMSMVWTMMTTSLPSAMVDVQVDRGAHHLGHIHLGGDAVLAHEDDVVGADAQGDILVG